MVIGMKTTVELPDNLLIEAKQKAAELRRPLKSLIEEGLRTELRQLRTTKLKKRAPINRDKATAKHEVPDRSSPDNTDDWLKKIHLLAYGKTEAK